MKDLTLDQCNALPIEVLVIAVIVERTNTPAAKAFQEACPDKWQKSIAKAKLQCRRQATSDMCDFLTETQLLSVPKEETTFWNGVNAVRDLAVMFGDAKFERPSVLYRSPDGDYYDLNGYGNCVYKESSLRDIRPFSDYFTRNQFRFVSAEKQPKTPNQNGIHIDMKWEADGFERYESDIGFKI